MDPHRRVLIEVLSFEERAVERERERTAALHQPLAALLEGGYSYDLLPDGTEVLRGAGVKISVPPACVEWEPGRREALVPRGPTEMDPVRQRVLRRLQRESAVREEAPLPPPSPQSFSSVMPGVESLLDELIREELAAMALPPQGGGGGGVSLL